MAFASVDTDSALKIEPQLDHRYASNIATRFLTNYHYKRTRLDDEISSEIFDNYFKLLDPNRIYFLGGDIEIFERYRNSLDDALRHSDLLPAYEMFNVYIDACATACESMHATAFRSRSISPSTSSTSTTAKTSPGLQAPLNWMSCGAGALKTITCACC